MKKGDLKRIQKEWADPREEAIIARIEKKAQRILTIQKELALEAGKLKALARRRDEEDLIDSLEEAACHLQYLEEDLDSFVEEIKRDRLPEASHLLMVLEEKVGCLK